MAGPDGTVLAQATAPPPGDLPAAANGIQRRELCRILLNAAVKAGARLFHGTTIVTIAGGDDAVTVTFRGEPTLADGRYDLLLSFDGVRSAIRRHLFGEKYQPQLTGFSVWRVLLPRPAELERTVFAFAGPVKATLIPLGAHDCHLALVAPGASRSTAAQGHPGAGLLGRADAPGAGRSHRRRPPPARVARAGGAGPPGPALLSPRRPAPAAR